MVDASSSSPDGCPDAERLVEFARGLLVGESHEIVLDHARGCEACGVILAAFTQVKVARAEPVDAARAVDAVADTAFAFGPVTTAFPLASSVQLGDLVDQKYRVKGLVGAGGMGVVVAATHVQIGRSVALKFMRPEACKSAEGVARFIREARACAQIQSEHVARLLDVGTLRGGEPYMVMELLTGSDLADLIRTRGPLPVEDAVDYVLQAGEAVAEAHGLGIVHRDLKPANLFLSRRPEGSPLVKVLDFGISKLTADAADAGVGLTNSGAAVGSPRYMSPEQLSSPRDVGPPADIWAFGCILYELLTGEAAFGGETMHSVAVAIATKPAPKARARRADLPRLVDEVIASCLEKDPRVRIQSVADLALRLGPLAPPSSRVSIDRICRLTGRPPPVEEKPAQGRTRVGLIAGVVALLGVGAAVLVSATHDPRPAAAPPGSPAADQAPTPSGDRAAASVPAAAAPSVPAESASAPEPRPSSIPDVAVVHAETAAPSRHRPAPSAVGSSVHPVATVVVPPPPPSVLPAPSSVSSMPSVLQDRK